MNLVEMRALRAVLHKDEHEATTILRDMAAGERARLRQACNELSVLTRLIDHEKR